MFGFQTFFETLFNKQYKCFSVSMLPGNDRQDVERGGKIIMPPSALRKLTRLNIHYPMLFKLTNRKMTKITHCGVLEFVADEGRVYLPVWMMKNLLLEEGALIEIESISLPVATFSRFQPQSIDFLDITNPKAVLENGLRHFACLTAGDMIAIKYNQKIYELSVLETEPGNAVTIIECDMNVEFAPPVDYKEPEKQNTLDTSGGATESLGFIPFKGLGQRLDGKQNKELSKTDLQLKQSSMRGVPDYEFQIGSLTFIRNLKPDGNAIEIADDFKPFSGQSYSLK